MRFDGIIFDLDGTLWDSTQAVAESWNISLRQRYNSEKSFSATDIAGIMGLTEKEIAQRLFSEFGEKANEVCHSCLMDEPAYLSKHGGKLYPHTKEILQLLSSDKKLFIISNCQSGYIESFLEYSGLGACFTDHACEGTEGKSKWENILMICEKHRLMCPVFIGDTASDEKNCAIAKCPFVHVTYGFGKAISPLGQIDSPEQLPALLENL